MNPGTSFSVPEAAIVALLNETRFADREFVQGGATFAEIYAMASWLRATLAGPEHRGTVCLATEDRALIAAALLAALAGGPVLLLPFAFSCHALAGMQQATGFTVVLADNDTPGKFPPGIEVIKPQWGETRPGLRHYPAAPG